MRIVIDTSDDAHPVRLEPDAVVATSGVVDDANTDGGAGPTDQTAAAGRDGPPAGDSGPPPAWLLDAIAAAQAAEPTLPVATSEQSDALISDAGAGPLAATDPYDTSHQERT